MPVAGETIHVSLEKFLMSMVRCRSKSYQEIERVSSEELSLSSKSSSRRVWGQSPGQLFLQRLAISLLMAIFLNKNKERIF